ncbi:Uncharacterised protein [Vibrio cholerae]|nr:Uncharacterised protein [Vibrio cholerae]
MLSLYNETNNVVSNLTKAQDSQAVIAVQHHARVYTIGIIG